MKNDEVGFRSIAPLLTNVKAIESALMFATGHQSFVALVGPSGCGKSLLLKAANTYIRKHVRQEVEYLTATQFLKLEGRISLDKTLIIDDCQEVFGKPKQFLRLRLALDRRIRGNRPTLLAFTGSGRDRRIRSLLPMPRKWGVESISEPDLAGRIALVQHLAKQEKMNISPTFARIIASRILGNGRVISGALRRLRLEKSEWTEAHQVLRGCGLLDPFFADNPQWDLRYRIAKVSNEIVSREQSNQHTSNLGQELACYVMTEVSGLCESSVSQYLDIDPGTCYQRATRMGQLVRTDAAVARMTHQCAEQVLARLA